MTDGLDAFRTIVGAAQVLTAPADLDRYNGDGRGGGGAARAVVRPATTDEVAATMRAAHGLGLPLIVQGARTGLVAAGLAENHIVLSLERLSRPPRIDPLNRTAEADAGVTLSALNAAAAAHGLIFPIDLGADPSVGGMVAANTGGARFLRYGDVRRNLLALQVVLADGAGTILDLGRALWKDNGSLDLKQLFASSAGAMGVVTRATLALQPIPANRVCALVGLSAPAHATALLVALERGAGTLLTAFEGLSAAALDLALTHVPRLKAPFSGGVPPYCVLVELSGGGGLSNALLTDLVADAVAPLIERGDAVDALIDEGEALWAIRHAVPEGLRTAGTVIACDVAVRRGDLMTFRDRAREAVAAGWPDLIVADFGHIGDGGLHFNMVWPRDRAPAPPGLADAVKARVFEIAVRDFDGSFSAEHGVGPRNIDQYRLYTPPCVLDVAGRLQRLLAPAGLGRVDFGPGPEAPSTLKR